MSVLELMLNPHCVFLPGASDSRVQKTSPWIPCLATPENDCLSPSYVFPPPSRASPKWCFSKMLSQDTAINPIALKTAGSILLVNKCTCGVQSSQSSWSPIKWWLFRCNPASAGGWLLASVVGPHGRVASGVLVRRSKAGCDVLCCDVLWSSSVWGEAVPDVRS